jgi:hypothetical protein
MDFGPGRAYASVYCQRTRRQDATEPDEFILWYCSEPRLSFSKVVVTRFRISLENRGLAAGTINGRLAAVRRLAYEAADAGLLSPELAAGIRRVKGVKKLGVRLGNGSRQRRRAGFRRLLMPSRSKANGTARFSQCCLAAAGEDAGSKRPSMAGSRPQNSKAASYSVASAGLVNAGAKA